MNILEIQDELLRLEYPTLLPDHDPDIERYYYLRNSGQAQDAMHIFQARLKPRYPDDQFRTWLMRCYRSNDPAFKGLLQRGYRMLGERSLERIKRIIFYIADKADFYNPRDVYSTIKAAEDMLVFLPGDRYEAVAGMERYFRYAQVLRIRERSVGLAVNLIRSYMTNSLSVVEDERRHRRERERREQEQQRQRLVREDWESYFRQKKDGPPPGPLIDLSAVVFSPEDLVRIEIPKSLVKIEDQTLAYCIKYWNLIEDTTFERILFLYSRKYGTKNYDILMTIRRGRQGKKRDDEILASVMSSLVTGYYYSIRGDRYLQQCWNLVKGSLHQAAKSPVRLALPAPASRPLLAMPKAPPPEPPKSAEKFTQKPARKASAPAAPKAVRSGETKPGAAGQKSGFTALDAKAGTEKPAAGAETKPAAEKPAAVRADSRPAAPEPEAGKSPAQGQPVTGSAALKLRQENREAAVPQKPPGEVPPRPDRPGEAGETEASLKFEKTAAKKKTRRVKPVVSASPPGGSVSDRLRELSGRSYDVYHDLFFAKARPAIRRVMGAGRGIFFTVPEKVEDLVFNFLEAHYSDPYMNWADSEERTALRELGFDLESLGPIIDECFRML